MNLSRSKIYLSWTSDRVLKYSQAGRGGRVVSTSDCYVGGLPIKSSILPLLKHPCGEATGWLATNRLVGVAPEVNLGEHTLGMPLPSANKAAHSGFETQRRRHQKSKTGVSVAPQKGLMSSKNVKITNKKFTPLNTPS